MATESVPLRPEVKDEVLGRVLRRYLMQGDEQHRRLDPRMDGYPGSLMLDGSVPVAYDLEEQIIREVLEEQRVEFERRAWR